MQTGRRKDHYPPSPAFLVLFCGFSLSLGWYGPGMRTIILPCILYIGIALAPFPAKGEEAIPEPVPETPVMAELEPQATSTPPAPEISSNGQECLERCASNVLFLPGIKGSRLYTGETDQVWEPFGDHDIQALMLDADGTSLKEDIHTRPGKLVDYVALVQDIYGSFRIYMNGLVEDGTIQDWEDFVYDWRLSLPAIVGHASEEGETPDLERTLRSLASSSRSGRVSIVAHSNGGLVAKELIRSLGDAEAARLIDRVIFVGVPQSGAPQALAALLYGYKEGLPWWFPGIVSTGTARAFAENAPMSYHLLPSDAYFASAGASGQPVASFAGTSGYAEERGAYGDMLDSYAELRAFALAQDGGREKPHINRIDLANVLNPALLSYASDMHASLDAWTPPQGIDLYQIAGWGEETVSGIEFYEHCVLSLCKEMYRPTFTQEGDGVVPVSSALLLPESEQVRRFWLDLSTLNSKFGNIGSKSHGTMMTVEGVKEFVSDVIDNPTESSGSDFLTRQPVMTEDRLRIFMHSPLNMRLCDEHGSCVGSDVISEMDGARYGTLGEMKYITASSGIDYDLILEGYGSGTFTLEIQRTEDGSMVGDEVFFNVPVTEDTVATIEIGSSALLGDELKIDTDGDGTFEATITSMTNIDQSLEAGAQTGTHRSQRKLFSEEVAIPGTTLTDLYLRLLPLLIQYLEELRINARLT